MHFVQVSLVYYYVCHAAGTTVVYSGKEDSYLVKGLEPYTEYGFRLRLLYGCDKSPFSAVVIARTLEGG